MGDVLNKGGEIRCLQIGHLKGLGYEVNEVEIPFPDEAKLEGVALLVDYETPIDQQCRLLGIKNWNNSKDYKDLYPKPLSRWGWIYGVRDGKDMLGKSLSATIKEFRKNSRRGLMIVEGLALYRENPETLSDHNIDLFGSRFEFGADAPDLYLSNGRPELSSSQLNSTHPNWGSASAAVM